MAQPAAVDQRARLAALVDSLPFREALNLLMRLGIPAEDAMGVQGCIEHVGWRPLAESAPLSFEGDVLWCKGCWKWMHS